MAKKATASGTAFVEFGATGLRQYSGYVREEWLRELIGRAGLLALREMRDNDPIIAAIMFAVEMLLRSVQFRMEPDGDNPEDDQAADFLESCVGDMEVAWPDLLAEILSFLQYGYDVHEIVYKIRRGDDADPRYNSKYTDGLIGWRKFAVRGQETLLHWVFDQAGDATHMVQLLPTGGPLLMVPLDKCLHFRTTPYKGNPEGRSILRSMYNYYYLKKNIQQIEAIGVARDLAGMPVVTVPAKWALPGATEADKLAYQAAKELATTINRNEQEGIVIPAVYDADKNQIFKIELLSTGGRRQFATTEIINRYDHGMASSMLADFITLGSGSTRGVGSFAQSRNKSDLFSVAVVGYLDLICAEFNRKAVPDILKLNGMKGSAKLTHGDIARRDLEELGNYISNIGRAGALVPDTGLENHLREEAGLPAMDGTASNDLATGGDGSDDDPAGNRSDDPALSEGRGSQMAKGIRGARGRRGFGGIRR